MNKRIASSLLVGAAWIVVPAVAQAQASSSAYTSATRYDAKGRVTGTISPNDTARGYSAFIATRTTYDAAGRPIKVESGTLSSWQSESIAPASWSGFTVYKTVETSFDAQNAKLTERVKGSDGNTYTLTQYSYDAAGRLDCTATRMNIAAFTSFPASACTLGTQGSDGPDRITKNVYDAAGQLVQVREGVGTSVEAAEVTYSYTNNGKQEHVIDAGGNRAQLTYDGHDRQARWIFPSASVVSGYNDSTPANALASAGSVNAGDYEEYGYDSNGNRTSLRKRDGSTLTYSFDALNRMTVKVVPGSTTNTRDVYYSYDARGLMTSARFDNIGGEGVNLGYDGFGRKTSETLTMDSASRTVGSGYDADSQRTRLTYPDTNYINYYHDGLDRVWYTDLANNFPLFHMPYDDVGRLVATYRWSTGASNWSQLSRYYVDALSRVSTYQHNFNNSGYDAYYSLGYNPSNQLNYTQLSNDLYAWNGQTNVNRGYAPNGLNQYSAVGGTAFGYDANGNLTSDGTSSFSYDVENRLVSRTGPASASLRYDPLGRLHEVTGSSGTRRFLYDGDALLSEYDSAGNLLRRYVHGASAADDPLVWFEGAGVSSSALRHLYSNQQGSITAITDTNGNATNVNTYDEYGIPGASNTGAFQYTGQVWLPELGMYYYKARMYSPTLGRFMQVDPIGYKDQFNLYEYVGDDPVDKTDPTGLCDGENCPMNIFHPELEAQVAPVKAEIGRQVFNGLAIGVTLYLPGERLAVAAAARVLGFTGVRLTGLLATKSSVVLAERLSIAKAGVAALEKTGGKAISGAGTKTELRQGERLAAKYGGEVRDYAKVTSGATRTSDGASVQVHAYRNVETGKIYEPKLKIQ